MMDVSTFGSSKTAHKMLDGEAGPAISCGGLGIQTNLFTLRICRSVFQNAHDFDYDDAETESSVLQSSIQHKRLTSRVLRFFSF